VSVKPYTLELIRTPSLVDLGRRRRIVVKRECAFLCGLCILFLTACSGGPSSATTTPTTPTPSKLGYARYVTFVNANADSIWANDQGTEYQLGGLWQGPFDSADATAQTSALDALIAATELNNTTSNSSLRHADDPNNK
jgi:hypothetical protein